MILPIILNTTIFSLISLLHFYWAYGGKMSSGKVIPQSKEGKLLFNPGILSTLVVAFGLLFFAIITFGNTGFLDSWINHSYITYGTWMIALIFLVRAIGDFKYVGFFKKVKGSGFAKNDTQLYSPLCMCISLISFLIIFLD